MVSICGVDSLERIDMDLKGFSGAAWVIIFLAGSVNIWALAILCAAWVLVAWINVRGNEPSPKHTDSDCSGETRVSRHKKNRKGY